MEKFSYEIVKHYGILSGEKSGWQKELNLVSWSGRAPKLDVRDWAPGHEKMGKGVTLTEGEAAALAELLVAALAKPESQ
ncbi:MAG: PC4/YdbC family ssDNA-binding protein [Treponema sp.]|nr:PC4/YdbC family ssDNA-binding protein [Treponema sp.]